MKKIWMTISILLLVLLSACGKNPTDKTAEGTPEDEKKIVIRDAKDTTPFDSTFKDPFVEGSLNYRVKGYKAYGNLSEAGIDGSQLMEPHNTYHSQELGEQYQTIPDFTGEDGNIADTHRLVILDMEIENVDAVGLTKKDEFNISGLSLRGGSDVSQYNVAYFSEAGKVDAEKPLYYELAQGQKIEVQLGYLVLKDDMDNLIGAVSDSDIQFGLMPG